MTSFARRRTLGSLVVLALTGVSAVGFYMLSVALGSEPPAQAFEGWVGVIQPESSLGNDVQVRVSAEALASDADQNMAYGLSLCGNDAFSGYFLIGEDARLDQIVFTGTSGTVDRLPDSDLKVQVLANGTTEILKSVQVFRMTFTSLPACVNDGIQSRTYYGTGFRLTGVAEEAVVSSAAGPVRGIIERWSMPYVGGLPGQESLGVFRIGGGIEGDFIRPASFAAVVDAGAVPMRMDIEQARPETTEEGRASWYSTRPLQATVTVNDSARSASLQRLLAIAAIFLGVFGSMFAAIALDWLRPPPQTAAHIRRASPASLRDTLARQHQSQQARDGPATRQGWAIAVVVALAGGLLIGRRRGHRKSVQRRGHHFLS